MKEEEGEEEEGEEEEGAEASPRTATLSESLEILMSQSLPFVPLGTGMQMTTSARVCVQE